jgi:hypothetical protein
MAELFGKLTNEILVQVMKFIGLEYIKFSSPYLYYMIVCKTWYANYKYKLFLYININNYEFNQSFT